ncbi:MAG TPA: glycoside hydrolase family 3 N-terminal domain-containing protein [Candidatus Limnocylindria bacterium]|nr:glycoside hydrolase family 3 N-terminal domain-containing protein [Candidatus Limnocylindria bacterium]
MKLGTGALVWGGFDGPQAPGPFLDAIRTGTLGGVLLFAFRGNIRSKAQVRAMLREIQDAARRGGLPPVPVAVDQEGGTVIRIGYRATFPSAMAIGATGDPAYAERAARAVGQGLRADGIAVNHAPVCDVNSDARNPVIGTRSFGDDAERVAEFAAAWVRGSEGVGVATTPKHFPGHGHTSQDSHLVRPDANVDRATLEERELVPFRAAFAAGASGAMAAHVRYPALDPDDGATVSRAILTDLLRGELGFGGLAVTDSLDMKGITDVDAPDHIVVRTIAAGADAAMVTTGLDLQLAAAGWIDAGVDRARVDEALERTAVFRRRFATPVPDEDIDDTPARGLAAEIAEGAITHHGPPLPALTGRVRVVTFGSARQSFVEETADPVGVLERALRQRFEERLAFGREGRVPEGEGTLVVCTSNAAFQPDQAARARELLAGGGVLCAIRSPYDAALVPGTPALLTYSDVPPSLEALAAVIAGERRPTGRLPVRI